MALIDGKALAGQITAEVAAGVAALGAPAPRVVFVRVGEDPASVSYVKAKNRTAAEIGMESRTEVFPESITQDELLAVIDGLNADPTVHGILVQAPLPAHMDERTVFNRVHPDKDIDGFSQTNLGRLVQDDPRAFHACTPAGIIELLARTEVPVRGRHVVIVGRSLIVGKPVALLLLRKHAQGDATVTVAHSRTADLGAITRQADILIAAIGRPHTITADMVKEGATVIDVGINRVEDASRKRGYRLVGDVDFDAVAPKAAHITPVPGGVGPLTIALLMRNTLQAARAARAAHG